MQIHLLVLLRGKPQRPELGKSQLAMGSCLEVHPAAGLLAQYIRPAFAGVYCRNQPGHLLGTCTVAGPDCCMVQCQGRSLQLDLYTRLPICLYKHRADMITEHAMHCCFFEGSQYGKHLCAIGLSTRHCNYSNTKYSNTRTSNSNWRNPSVKTMTPLKFQEAAT